MHSPLIPPTDQNMLMKFAHNAYDLTQENANDGISTAKYRQ